MSSRSSKRSGTTPSKPRRRRRRRPPLDPAFVFPPFYVDACVSQVDVPEALRHLGFTVYRPKDVFPNQPEVDDPTWLKKCGGEGWVALSKDKLIRHRPNEVAMVRSAKVGMFVIAAHNGATRTEQVAILTAAMASIRRYIRELDRPFIVAVYNQGRTKVLLGPGVD